MSKALDNALQRRVIIEGILPEVDGGDAPAKCVKGDTLEVSVDLVADGHDRLGGVLRYRHADDEAWQETSLTPGVNDRWAAGFPVDRLGRWSFQIEAWVDAFASWRHGLERKVAAAQDVSVELQVGAQLVEATAERAEGPHAAALRQVASRLSTADAPERVTLALGDSLAAAVAAWPDRSRATRSPTRELYAEPERARFSAWYELFPRSYGQGDTHGTFGDVERHLDYIAELGFDVLYLPPIHPIGEAHRKGPNNALEAGPDDPGSPWAIGAAEGGHKAVHPSLGTLDGFERLVAAARTRGIEVAIDIAFQASPDHPYVSEHPEWFIHRPDGTIRYAENPPKKYQDVLPFDFEGPGWQTLWPELCSIFLFWAERGVRLFRVDNPHTKPLRFWRWCLAEVRRSFPDTIFLAEAFTRPKVMYGLAKAGFSQSYTYFTWRNTAAELTAYLEELTHPGVAAFFRPSFWPNTPDILPEHLQYGGRGAFISRLVLAATLSSNYGIYGPAFELMERDERPGSGEYRDNEKYQLRDWDLAQPDSLRHVIARINRIRRENRALHHTQGLRFHSTDNPQLLCYSKRTDDGGSAVLVVVNLDPHHRQAGYVELDPALFDGQPVQVHDMLSEARYLWSGPRNYVELDPAVMPAHIFRLRRRLRTEHDFDYFA